MRTINFETHPVYPGEFTPVTNEALVIKQLKGMRDSGSNRPYTNVKELIGEYKIEIAAPGFEREQLIVYTDKNDWLICATNNYNAVKPLQKHLSLAADADLELAIAEYKNNILELYIPKAKQACKSSIKRVVVY